MPFDICDPYGLYGLGYYVFCVSKLPQTAYYPTPYSLSLPNINCHKLRI